MPRKPAGNKEPSQQSDISPKEYRIVRSFSVATLFAVAFSLVYLLSLEGHIQTTIALTVFALLFFSVAVPLVICFIWSQPWAATLLKRILPISLVVYPTVFGLALWNYAARLLRQAPSHNLMIAWHSVIEHIGIGVILAVFGILAWTASAYVTDMLLRNNHRVLGISVNRYKSTAHEMSLLIAVARTFLLILAVFFVITFFVWGVVVHAVYTGAYSPVTQHGLTDAVSCLSITDERNRLSCFSESLTNRTQCETFQSLPQSPRGLAFCNAILAIKARNTRPCFVESHRFDVSAECVGALAYYYNDESMCDEQLYEVDEKDTCLRLFGARTLDYDVCERITDSRVRADCIVSVAAIKHDAAKCDELTNPDDRSYCAEWVTP